MGVKIEKADGEVRAFLDGEIEVSVTDIKEGSL